MEPQLQRVRPKPEQEEVPVSAEPLQGQASVVLPKREAKAPEAQSFEDEAKQQAQRELAEMSRKREEARAAAASQVVARVTETLKVIESTNLTPEPEVQAPQEGEPPQAVEDDVDELMDHDEGGAKFYPYVYEGLLEEVILGEGLESRVSRGVDAATGMRVLKYEAKEGMGDYLRNHAEHLQKLSHKSGFLKLIHLSDDEERPFMLCADPGTIPLSEEIKNVPVNQRVSLVKQLADCLRVIHSELKVLHRDLRPDQLYVVKKEGGDYELILGDFGVAVTKDEENDLECSLQDPVHAKATDLIKFSFISSDAVAGIPYDERAEIEVFSKVAAFILTGLIPAFGVEKALNKSKVKEKTPEMLRVEHGIKVASSDEREDRYHSMSEFCYDMNAREPMTPEQRQALHAIQDTFMKNLFDNDFDALFAQAKILGEGEIQLSAEPLKELRKRIQGVSADLPSIATQRAALQQLDAALAQSIGTLEKDELGIIQELEQIGKERDRQFNQEESVTHGDEIIIAFLDHPSDRVKAAAVQASSLTHRNRTLIPCGDRVIGKAREVLLGSRTTEYPQEWRSLWGWCTLERSEIGRGFLTGDNMKDKTSEKDLFIRMVGEDVDHKDRVFSTLKASVYYFSIDDVIKISSVAVERLKSLQQASLEGKIIHEDHEMANAHSWSFGLYGVLRDMVENLKDYSVMEEEKDKQMILKAQEGIVDFLLQYRHSQSSYFREKLSTPFWFQGHPGSNSEMTKEWDPAQICRMMNGIAEASEGSLFTCATWIPTNLLRHGHITAEVAVKVLRRLIKDGQKLSDFDCDILESAYRTNKEGAAACVGSFLIENMSDPEVKSTLERPRLLPVIRKKMLELLATLRKLGKEKPDSDPEVAKTIAEISDCLKNNDGARREFGTNFVYEHLHDGRLSSAIALATEALEFNGELLTKLMNDIFEAAKKDPVVKSEYRLLPWKNRGRKYFIEGTNYDGLLAKLVDKIHKTWSEKLNAVDPNHAQILPGYVKSSIDLADSIYKQLADVEKSAFAQKVGSRLGKP